jgi:hypothetical protein
MTGRPLPLVPTFERAALGEIEAFSPDLLHQALEDEVGLGVIADNAFDIAADALGELLDPAINDDPMDVLRRALGQLPGQAINGNPMDAADEALDQGAELAIEEDASSQDELKSFDWDRELDTDLRLFT